MSLQLDQPDAPRIYRLSVEAYHQLGDLGFVGENVGLLCALALPGVEIPSGELFPPRG